MKASPFIFLSFAILANRAFADVTIADFESPSEVVASPNVTTERIHTDSPQGQSYLRLNMKSDELAAGLIRLPLNSEISFKGQQRLTAQVRVRGTGETKVLRWLALDERGKPIFQRRFNLKPGESWVQIDEPLRTWRWHDANAGDWSEVRELGLRIETPTGEVDVDDIRLTGTATPREWTDWLLRLAFEDRPVKRFEESGMLVATDAADGFADADLRNLVNDMLHVRAWVKRVFAETVRPIDGEGPVMLLIFSNDADRQAFFRRLGEQWRATLSPPAAQGFTVQDICSSTYHPAQGLRRPVYLHESVHGIVARELRLPSGFASTSPLQEGLANYLQLCVHPKSLPRSTFVNNFNKPIDPAGKGFFKPLNTLFDTRAEAEQYAQLASLVAYLVERDPSLLRALARGLADGDSASAILARQGTGWPALPKSWLEWGQARFKPQSLNSPEIFDLPVEFR